MRVAAWVVGALLGAAWGVAFFSWTLPLPIVARPVVTVLIALALGIAGPAGLLAAAGFAIGMAITAATLLASAGEPPAESWWALVPGGALVAAIVLHLLALGLAHRRKRA